MDVLNSVTTLEQQLVNLASQKKTPLGGSLELLPLCNMNCDMCYVRLSKEEMKRKGRLRSVKEWLGLAHEMKEQGVLFLLLTGGEPFLYEGFKDLYLELLRMGMIITINTNGTLIDEDMADFLGQHKPRRINITLYGKDKATYQKLCHYEDGFDKTIRGIRLLRERDVQVKLNGSLTKSNREDLKELLDIANELQVPIHIDTYMYPASRERDFGFCDDSRLSPKEAANAWIDIARYSLNDVEFEKYRKSLLEQGNQKIENADCSMSCRAGKSSFVVNWKGDMTPCIMLQQPAVNVFEKGFKEAWKYLVQEVEKIKISVECATCNHKKLCNTCAACALLEEGDYEKVPIYMCEYTKGMLESLSE